MLVPISDQVTSLPRACGGEISATAVILSLARPEARRQIESGSLTVDRVDREAEAAAQPDQDAAQHELHEGGGGGHAEHAHDEAARGHGEGAASAELIRE